MIVMFTPWVTNYEVPHAEKSASGCLEFTAAVESASQAQHVFLPLCRAHCVWLGGSNAGVCQCWGESVDGVGSGGGSRSRCEPRFSDPIGECPRTATLDSVEANTWHRYDGQCADRISSH